MRIDKLTTKFQQALSEAQSIALAKDNQYIEPAHVLLAMLRDSDGSAKSLLTRAGVNVPGLEKGVEKNRVEVGKLEDFENEFVPEINRLPMWNIKDLDQ